MDIYLQNKFKEDKKMYQYLKDNSYYYKELNRDPLFYKKFVSNMKELYHERVIDKVSNAVSSIDLIEGIIKALNEWYFTNIIICGTILMWWLWEIFF